MHKTESDGKKGPKTGEFILEKKNAIIKSGKSRLEVQIVRIERDSEYLQIHTYIKCLF